MGVLLIAAGFILAVVAGLWLALQLAQGMLRADEAAVGAAVVFLPAAALVVFGLYVRVRGRRQIEPPSATEQQRDLVDLLNQRQQIPVQEMAAALGVDEAALHDLVEQLIHLEVFAGYVDWQAGMMYASRREDQLPSGGGRV